MKWEELYATMQSVTIEYRVSPPVSDAVLNALFEAAWEHHEPRAFQRVLAMSLVYVCAFASKRLVGFVNVAWDGGDHAFVLDTTVHPQFQRQGIGAELVKRAATVARSKGIEWLHVDFEPRYASFHYQCGFVPSQAGLMRLRAK